MSYENLNQQPDSGFIPEAETPFIVLPENDGIEISYDDGSQHSLIELENPEEYPHVNDAETALKTMLLEETDNGKLILPANFVTLGQALNDASGSMRMGRGQISAHKLFQELGSGLKLVAEMESAVPSDISYLNVIYSREELGAKLLPPIEFIEFDDQHEEQAKKSVVDALWKSLQDGARNDQQRRLITEAYGGFIGAFEG